jgi:hypothetical protein
MGNFVRDYQKKKKKKGNEDIKKFGGCGKRQGQFPPHRQNELQQPS